MNSHKTVQRWAKSVSVCGLLITMVLTCAALAQAQEPIQEGEEIVRDAKLRTNDQS